MKGVSFFQDMLNSLFERAGSSAAGQSDSRSLSELCEALLSERGEVSGHLLASQVLDRIESLNSQEQLAFFELLTNEFDIDATVVVAAANDYASSATTKNFARLRQVAEPGRQELLRRLNSAPQATARLVKMREALLAQIPKNPALARTDLDFEHLFASWFNRGFLVMRRIDWQSPASLLEKIIAYEAVHAINDWDDLRRRLLPSDRRCFAFFHPAMPDEPLIFVQVALVKDPPQSIQQVLSDEREPVEPAQTNTAVFYSISNCQKGLRGVSFGNFLIKQVAKDLAEELPQIKHFITLSPVPGLMSWVDRVMKEPSVESVETDLESLAVLREIADGGVREIDTTEQKNLLMVVAHYMYYAKRENGYPIDSVSRFHLGNGACLDKIIWGADKSRKGLQQSASIMVNYRYELSEIEARHQSYVSQATVHVGKPVRALLDHSSRSSRKQQSDSGPDSSVRAPEQSPTK